MSKEKEAASTAQTAPENVPEQSQDIKDLLGLVAGLQNEVNQLKNPKPSIVRSRVKEHTAMMREYRVDDEAIGLVTRLFRVRQVRDKEEAKRYKGICDVEVFNPRTKKTTVEKDIDYLDFLNAPNSVQVLIRNMERTRRIEVELSKGGGGVAARYSSGAIKGDTVQGETLAEQNYPFAVEFEDVSMDIEILEGAFAGETFTHAIDGNSQGGLNL